MAGPWRIAGPGFCASLRRSIARSIKTRTHSESSTASCSSKHDKPPSCNLPKATAQAPATVSLSSSTQSQSGWTARESCDAPSIIADWVRTRKSSDVLRREMARSTASAKAGAANTINALNRPAEIHELRAFVGMTGLLSCLIPAQNFHLIFGRLQGGLKLWRFLFPSPEAEDEPGDREYDSRNRGCLANRGFR